jgi:hypothetical protein
VAGGGGRTLGRLERFPAFARPYVSLEPSRWGALSHGQPVFGLQGGESLLGELLDALLDPLAS